jgi:hypothetical protein
MAQVLQTNCDYKVKTQTSGTITLDTSPIDGSPGTVRITGDLVVEGDQITVNVSDLFVEDNIIRLNLGETGNGVTEIYSGLEVDRGFGVDSSRNLYATFWYNENIHSWEIVDQSSGATPLVRFEESSLKLKQIITNSGTDEGDLTLIGSGTGVVKVAGTTNYEQQVTDDDDVPNKRYVDLSIRNREPNNRIQRDDTYVIVRDINGGAIGSAVMGLFHIVINQTGANYALGDILFITLGTYSLVARVEITGVDGSGGVTSVSLTDAGLYSVLTPTNTNVSTTTNSVAGSGATLDIDWRVRDVNVINGGDDYESANVFFSFSSGSETQAVGTPIIDTNPLSDTFREIVSVTITDSGLYLTIPTVSFSAGAPSAFSESEVEVVVENSIAAVFYSNRVEIGSLEIIDNAIVTKAGSTNDNIVLDPNGTGKVEINYGVQLNNANFALTAVTDSTVIFSDGPSIGNTGVYYNTDSQVTKWSQWVTNNNTYDATDLALYPVKNELISKNKALVFSMLF